VAGATPAAAVAVADTAAVAAVEEEQVAVAADDGDAWDFPRRLRRRHDDDGGHLPDHDHLRLRMELLAGRAMAYDD